MSDKKPEIIFQKPVAFLNNIPRIVEDPFLDEYDLAELQSRYDGSAKSILFNKYGKPVCLDNLYLNGTAFLIGCGPSFNSINKNILNLPGVLTLSVNNAIKSFRSDLWVSVDEPNRFIKSIWIDPKITKFVPFAHVEKTIFDNEKWEETNIQLKDCPNIIYYCRNERFNPNTFLTEDTVNWGNHAKIGGSRSVMLAAIRILYHLGIRKIFLLGVDFIMNENYKYHFNQDRTIQALNNNNFSYNILIERFQLLKPIFEKNNLQIYNCNKNSMLNVFEYIEFEEAIKISTKNMPNVENEKTEGLYERLKNENKI